MDELARLQKLYEELSIKYRGLEERFKTKAPRAMRWYFFAGVLIGLLIGFFLGTAMNFDTWTESN